MAGLNAPATTEWVAQLKAQLADALFQAGKVPGLQAMVTAANVKVSLYLCAACLNMSM